MTLLLSYTLDDQQSQCGWASSRATLPLLILCCVCMSVFFFFVCPVSRSLFTIHVLVFFMLSLNFIAIDLVCEIHLSFRSIDSNSWMNGPKKNKMNDPYTQKRDEEEKKRVQRHFSFRHRHLLSLLTQYCMNHVEDTITIFIFGNFHHHCSSLGLFRFVCCFFISNLKRKRNVLNSMTKLCLWTLPSPTTAAASAVTSYFFFHCMILKVRDTRQTPKCNIYLKQPTKTNIDEWNNGINNSIFMSQLLMYQAKQCKRRSQKKKNWASHPAWTAERKKEKNLSLDTSKTSKKKQLRRYCNW